jgi:hypothetical protein
MKIPMEYIIELGLLRKRNVCAKCKRKMNVKDYHIQLCRKCRLIELDKFEEEQRKRNILHNKSEETSIKG